MHHEQGLATFFFEGQRGDGTTLSTFFIGPDEARGRSYFEIPAEERHGIRVTLADEETVLAPDTNIHLAGMQGHAKRLWYPPLPEDLGLGKRLEHDARRAIDGSRDDELTIGLPFHRRAVLRGGALTLSCCFHRTSPSVSVPGRPCPTHQCASPI